MRTSTAVVLSLLLAGCASTVYKTGATKLGAAASALAVALPSQGKVDAEGKTVLDLNTDILMLGGPIKYTSDCGDKAFGAYKAFVGSLDEAQVAQTSAFETLVKSPACGIIPVTVGVASTPGAPIAGSNAAGQTSEQSKAAETRLARGEAHQAAVDAVSRRGDRSRQPPVCKGSCTLEDYTSQIKAYGDAIQAASTAQDVSDAQTAVRKADSAIDGLLKAAKAPPLAEPIVDIAAAVGKLAIQQAQYAAMKHAVLAFDQVWPQVAPAVETAAKFRQAQLISYRADASQNACLAAQLYLNDDHNYRAPTERLQLFTLLGGKVDSAAASLESAEIDPGAAIAAFSRANHTLALAMEDPRRQSATLLADLNAVQTQIAAIQKAAAPAKPTTGASHG